MIRVLHVKQFAILTSILRISALITNILFEKRKRRFGILEHFPYLCTQITKLATFSINKTKLCSGPVSPVHVGV